MIRKTLDYSTTKDDEPYRIRTILRMRLGVSTRFLRACRNDGDLLRNGVHTRTVDGVTEGDVLTLVFPETAPPEDVPPEEIPLEVLYEDEDFLAVRKPPGLPVHPSKGHPSGTLLNGIVRKIRDDERDGRSEAYEPHLINRLDRDTSGIVLIGKNAYVQDAFADLAKRGAVEKTYAAVVCGIPEPPEGVIDRPIGQPDPSLVRRAVVSEEEGGYPSRTRYRTIETFRVMRGDAAIPFALLNCTLETGRTHQIRVHLASIGCPIAGDALYGPASDDPRYGALPIARQALSAVRLAFDHPVTHRRVVIETLPDDDIRNLLNELKKGLLK